MNRRVLMPLPDIDFDPSESGVPWHVLRSAGHEVVFSTESGSAGRADPKVLAGVLFGQLGPEPEARRHYDAMIADDAFQNPLRWSEIDPDDYDGLFLAGGHAKGMCPYFESPILQDVVRAFFAEKRPVAAVCHGTLLLARTRDASGHSVLHNRRSTCLPKYMERTAWWATAWKLGRYYRTYDAYVEDEVSEALGPQGTYERGPIHLFAKGSATDHRATHVVRDGHYLSARWPGDVFAIGEAFATMLHEMDAAEPAVELQARTSSAGSPCSDPANAEPLRGSAGEVACKSVP